MLPEKTGIKCIFSSLCGILSFQGDLFFLCKIFLKQTNKKNPSVSGTDQQAGKGDYDSPAALLPQESSSRAVYYSSSVCWELD